MLPAPLSWVIKPLQFTSLVSTLSIWRPGYERSSAEYECSLEMIEWYKMKEDSVCRKGCVALYYVHDLRALAQFYQTKNSDRIVLRSLITPKHEYIAGTILLYKVINADEMDIDWDALCKNHRWYIAASFLKNNGTFFSM